VHTYNSVCAGGDGNGFGENSGTAGFVLTLPDIIRLIGPNAVNKALKLNI